MDKAIFRKHGNKRFDLALSILALLIMLLTLFWSPQIGLSDNGDFARVMAANSIVYEDGSRTAFTFVDTYKMELTGSGLPQQAAHLLFSTENMADYPSIQHVFVRVSQIINLIFNIAAGYEPHIYRIGVYGALMCVLYAMLLYALFRRIQLGNPWDVILKLIIILVLCDSGYTAYFNSFYSESIQILALLCVAVTCTSILKKPELRLPDAALFMASLIFYGWSKFVNIPVGIAGILIFLYLIIRKTLSGHKTYAALLSGGALLALIAIYLSVPKWMDFQTNYNAVFFGALKDTDAAQSEKYLRDLQLPPYMAELRSTHFYMDEILPITSTERFTSDFAHIGKGALLRFYLKNPGHLLSKLELSIESSGFIRPFYLSNFGDSAERAAHSNRFSLWSGLRKAAPFNKPLANILLACGFIIVFLSLLRLRTGDNVRILSLLLFFGAAAVYALAVPIICNGEGDIAKHMFAYTQLVDYAVLILLYLAMRELSALKRPGVHSYISLAICGAFIVSSLGGMALRTLKAHAAHSGIEPGSYLSFGRDDRGAIPWIVTGVGEDGITLLAARCVNEMSFSKLGEYGSNLWEQSDIRKWLNTDFLNRFSEQEKQRILPSVNRHILANAYRNLATSGNRSFFCWHIPELCARGLDEAYGAVLSDYVFLPDVAALQKLLKTGAAITREAPYWLSTPYYSNDSMVRIVGSDGYVYMRDASSQKGVVPMLRISGFEVTGGSGSISEPFREH